MNALKDQLLDSNLVSMKEVDMKVNGQLMKTEPLTYTVGELSFLILKAEVHS